MSRFNAVKIMQIAHCELTVMVLLTAVLIFFFYSSMGEPEYYSFLYYDAVVLQPTLLSRFLFIFDLFIVFYLVSWPVFQIPFYGIYFLKSNHNLKKKLVRFAILGTAALIFYLVVSLPHKIIPSSDIPIAVALMIILATTYFVPFWINNSLVDNKGQLFRYKAYRTFLLSHFVVYAFLFAYSQGVFPGMEESLTVFLDSYSRLK